MEPRSGGRYAGAPGAAAPPSGSEATDKGSVAEAAAEDAAVTVAAAAMRGGGGGEARHRQVQRGIKGIPRTGPPSHHSHPPPPQCQRVPLCALGWDAFLLVPGLQKRKRWGQKKRALPRDILQGLRVPIGLEKWSFAHS